MRIVIALFAFVALSVAAAGCEFAPLPGDVKIPDSTAADIADADAADAAVAGDEAGTAEIDTSTETVAIDDATEADVATDPAAEAADELPANETVVEALAETVDEVAVEVVVEVVAETVAEVAPVDTPPTFDVADVQLPDSCDEACLADLCGDCLCAPWELPDGSSPCPKDCVVCGDGVCGCGETTACPADCV